ncbi:hypothetical protein NKW55_14340 [Gluconobacter kondonii]|nr:MULTISPECIES: hypothetical protein [Gluconobacter]MCP1237755.1 hypothetical protein [Gluconobacter kondonii]
MLQCVSTSHGIAKMGGVGELVQVIADTRQFTSQATNFRAYIPARTMGDFCIV